VPGGFTLPPAVAPSITFSNLRGSMQVQSQFPVFKGVAAFSETWNCEPENSTQNYFQR
jgi:hypothetical protein